MSSHGYHVWECKVVVKGDVQLPEGFDFPPRRAVIDAITAHGIDIQTCFSGWDGALSDCEARLANGVQEPDYPATGERLCMTADASRLKADFAKCGARIAELEKRLATLERDHNKLCGAIVKCGPIGIHPYSVPYNQRDLKKWNEEPREGE